MGDLYVSDEHIKEIAPVYARCIASTAFAYLKNTQDAEDIMQEVFLALLKCPPKIENDGHLKAWLIRVTMNKCKDYLKSAWVRKRAEMPENLTYMPKEHSDVIDAVLSLPEKYRMPVYLHYYEGYSLTETGKILGLGSGTVGTRLHRGRAMLREILGGDELE